MFKIASFSDEIAQAMLQNEQHSATSNHYVSEQKKINDLRQLEIQAEIARAISILSDISLNKSSINKQAVLPARDEELNYIEKIQEKIDLLKANNDPNVKSQMKVIESYFGHIIEMGNDFSELSVIDEALDKLYDKIYGDEIEVILEDEDESDARDKKCKKTKEEKNVFKHYGFGDRDLEDILADLDD